MILNSDQYQGELYISEDFYFRSPKLTFLVPLNKAVCLRTADEQRIFCIVSRSDLKIKHFWANANKTWDYLVVTIVGTTVFLNFCVSDNPFKVARLFWKYKSMRFNRARRLQGVYNAIVSNLVVQYRNRVDSVRIKVKTA